MGWAQSFGNREVVKPDGTIALELSKALYGCVQSAKLWQDEISNTLRADGFISNPKDECVFNKIVKGVQITLTLHVDDFMITSKSQEAIKSVIAYLSAKYGTEEQPLVVQEGKVHSFLGMALDFSKAGQVEISRPTYLKGLCSDVSGVAETPAHANLFTIRTTAKPLESEQSEEFHSVVAKLLYVSKRARPDVATVVAFLTRRCLAPDEDDWRKLQRCLQYLNGTLDLALTLSCEDGLRISAFVDASYAVHDNYRSHTGTMISLGRGATLTKSSMQKLNTKSSTEAELVALSDSCGHIIWTRDYLIGQGYKMGPVRVLQDNQSAMALVKRGYSTSEKTRHVNIRYFFVKDRVDAGELHIEYLPTEQMVADFFTKPLQGELFRKMRSSVMGHTTIGSVMLLGSI